jgi:hypothetical protein
VPVRHRRNLPFSVNAEGDATMKQLTLIAATLGLLALTPAQSAAEILVLNYSGTFGASTTIAGTPLGADTPFTLAATFDSTTDLTPIGGQGRFPTLSVDFDIAGFGTFSSAPGTGLEVDFLNVGVYIVELGDIGGAYFRADFSTASPPFDADDPTPSALSDLVSTLYFGFTIPLAGGAGDLVVPDGGGIVAFGPTATITPASPTAVPEPSAIALAALGVVGSLGLRRRLRKRT